MTKEMMKEMLKENPQSVLTAMLYSIKMHDFLKRIDEMDLAKLDEVDLLRLLTEVIAIINGT